MKSSSLVLVSPSETVVVSIEEALKAQGREIADPSSDFQKNLRKFICDELENSKKPLTRRELFKRLKKVSKTSTETSLCNPLLQLKKAGIIIVKRTKRDKRTKRRSGAYALNPNSSLDGKNFPWLARTATNGAPSLRSADRTAAAALKVLSALRVTQEKEKIDEICSLLAKVYKDEVNHSILKNLLDQILSSPSESEKAAA